MQNAGTVLDVLRERGRKGLPCEELYRQMFNKELYLKAYGRIYANHGAMTPGATSESKHSPHVLRVICGSGSAALYGEIACAGGCQGVPSMRSHRTAKAFLPCLRAVSM